MVTNRDLMVINRDLAKKKCRYIYGNYRLVYSVAACKLENHGNSQLIGF